MPEIGDIYWDCSYHPVRATEVDDWDVAGASLFDGSEPRSCSIEHCGVMWLNDEQVEWLLDHKQEFLDAEAKWRADMSNRESYSGYDALFEEMPEDLFPRS